MATNQPTVRVALLLIVSALLNVPKVTSAYVFGTISGYDNPQGLDPICWITELAGINQKGLGVGETIAMMDGDDDQSDPSILELQDSLFDTKDPVTVDLGNSSLIDENNTEPLVASLRDEMVPEEQLRSQVDMLPACFRGTDLEVTPPLDMKTEQGVGIAYANWNYTFWMNFQTNVTHTTQALSARYFDGQAYALRPPKPIKVVYFRLILCDAANVGFCNPFIDTRSVTRFEILRNNSDRQLVMGADNVEVDQDSDSIFDYDPNRGPLRGMEIDEGNHIFTRWVRLPINESKTEKGFYNATLALSVELPLGAEKRVYFVLAHAVMSFESDNGSNIDVRVDVADSIPGNLITIQHYPEILYVTKEMAVAVGVVSGVTSFLWALLLGFVLYHRNNDVMKLAQWPFLAWLLSSCVMANVFTFTILPTEDWFCRCRALFQYLPLHMIGAILVARIWRVYVTLHGALSIGTRRAALIKNHGSTCGKVVISTLTVFAKFPCCFNRGSSGKSTLRESPTRTSPSIRTTATAGESVKVILFLSLPQFIIQLFGVIFYSKTLVPEFNEAGDFGRVVCSMDGDWTEIAGTCLTIGVFVLAVVVAWIARDLPSAFNETDSVFQAATINTVIAGIVITLEYITNSPLTSPDVPVFLWLCMSVGITTSVCYFILLPKVQRVLSGEKVVLSRLINPSDLSTPTLKAGSGGATAGSAGEQEVITVNRNEPLPRTVERHLLNVNELLRWVTFDLVEGKQLRLDDWHTVIEEVALLHNDLDKLRFSWTKEDEDSSLENGVTDAA